MIKGFVFVAAVCSALSGSPRSKERAGKIVTLTARETQVLRLIVSGHRTKDIARELDVSPGTVKTHVERIFRKLETSNRTSAGAEALRRELIE
jgi:DNA-binding NarL/FixJ family response regulator